MRLFDFALLPGTDPRSEAEGTLDDILQYLEKVDGVGLVTSLGGAFYDFASGNRQTLEMAGRDQRLLPGMTADPRRLEAADLDMRAAADDGFRGLVLFPAIQNWPLSHRAAAIIAGKAGEAGLPVVLHVPRGTSVSALVGFARGVDAPVVACGLAYGSVGEVAAAAGDAGNLLFSMRLFCGLDNVESLAGRLGAEKLVFESGEPVSSHAMPLAVLEGAEISPDARELISLGNARRLMGAGL